MGGGYDGLFFVHGGGGGYGRGYKGIFSREIFGGGIGIGDFNGEIQVLINFC